MKNIFLKIKESINERFIISIKKIKKKEVKNPKKKGFLKYLICVLIPTCSALGGAFLGFTQDKKNKEKADIPIVEVVTSKINRRIYLLSNDNLTIPLTVELDKKNTLQEEIYDIFNLLKSNSKASNNYVKGFINNKTKLNSFVIKEKVLSLDFSKDFLDYGNLNETKILEALTLSFIQFDEIDGVSLLIDGNKLTRLPHQNIKVDDVLTKEKGINNILQSSLEIIGKEKTVIFYEKNLNENEKYLVPLSYYVNKGESKNITFVNGVNYRLSASLGLNKIDTYNALSNVQSSNEKIFTLNIEKNYLVDNTYVNKTLFDLVTLSLDLLNIEMPVSFFIENEEIPVQGVYGTEEQAVNSIVYNSVKV